MLFSSILYFSISNTAVAGTRPFDDTLAQAQTALLSANYEQVFELLDGAERAFERSVSIIKPQDLAMIFYYRGVAAQLNQGDGLPYFRSALTAYPSLE